MKHSYTKIELILVFGSSWMLAAVFKAYRDLVQFGIDTWLPVWESERTFMPLDSWHFGDAMEIVFLVVPFFYFLFKAVRKWYWMAVAGIASWLLFYQTFLYFYHGFFRVVTDWQHIWNSYKLWEYF